MADAGRVERAPGAASAIRRGGAERRARRSWGEPDLPRSRPAAQADAGAGLVARMSRAEYHGRLIAASAVKRRSIEWSWQGRVATRSLTILAGTPGEGKSLLTSMIAADLTTGKLSGSHFGRPRPVIFMSLEDDRAAVIRPRLEAMQADLDIVHFLDVEVTDSEDIVSFTL